jgi:HPr kinase/phosphorylase
VADKNYDRTGLDLATSSILGVNIPKVQIFVKPGRNIPIIIEAAVLAERDRLDARLTQLEGTGLY